MVPRLLTLQFRAPLLLLLFAVAVVMGNHWTLLQEQLQVTRGISDRLFWTVEVTQVLVVVVICTMPDLLMRRVSMLMVLSRVISLVVTLLLVILFAIYILRLNLFADVLIIASAVLLARLDLTRVGVLPHPALSIVGLASILLSGIWLGAFLPTPRLFASLQAVS